MSKLHVIDIARVCHEVNRVYRREMGEPDTGAWAEIAEEKRASITRGVQIAIDDPQMTPEVSHERWRAEQINAGHENHKAWSELPLTQRMKDHLFLGIVNALRPFLEG